HLLESLDAEHLGGWRGHQHDVCQRRGGVGPLDIKGDLEVPEIVVFQAGAIVRRWWDRRRSTLDLDDVETWGCRPWAVGRRVARPGFAAQMRKPECRIEGPEVLPDGARA